MYLKEAQRTPKVLESTGLHFDSIRTHNRCTARRVASGPCRPADRGEPGPKLDLTPKPTNSPTFVHSLYISGIQVYLMFKRLQKSGFVSLGRAAPPTGPWTRPARSSPPPAPAAGHRRAQILQAGLNLQIICDTKFTTKFCPQRGSRFAIFVLGELVTAPPAKEGSRFPSETLSNVV